MLDVATSSTATVEVIDSAALAKRWAVNESWIRHQVRPGINDPIPHLKLGKYIRFRWGGRELNEWLSRRAR
jgi:hypothetical protein